jgi:hypothetical protein
MNKPVKGQEGTIAIEGHPLNGAKVAFQHQNGGGSIVVKMLESRGSVFREGDLINIGPGEWADMKEGST